jgi:lipopolysaccharide export system permease protein
MDQKPTLSIEEGVFYQGFDNYTMRVGKKNRNNKDIYDVILFDHSKGQGNSTYLYAKSGKMEMTEDKMYMLFFLYDGYSWDESSSSSAQYPLVRATFSEQYKRFDISSFKFEKSDDNFYTQNTQALSNKELALMVDSVKMTVEKNNNDVFEGFLSSCYYFRNFVLPEENYQNNYNREKSSVENYSVQNKVDAINKTVLLKNDFSNTVKSNGEYKKYIFSSINSYKAEWYRKYVHAVACILFFFIGAPLGSIIRKGGVGIPLVITVAFFVAYFIISIFGEKIAKGSAVQVWVGMWLSSFILIPICAFLTYQASVDSALLSSEEIHKKIQQLNLKKIFAKKGNENTATHA